VIFFIIYIYVRMEFLSWKNLFQPLSASNTNNKLKKCILANCDKHLIISIEEILENVRVNISSFPPPLRIIIFFF